MRKVYNVEVTETVTYNIPVEAANEALAKDQAVAIVHKDGANQRVEVITRAKITGTHVSAARSMVLGIVACFALLLGGCGGPPAPDFKVIAEYSTIHSDLHGSWVIREHTTDGIPFREIVGSRVYINEYYLSINDGMPRLKATGCAMVEIEGSTADQQFLVNFRDYGLFFIGRSGNRLWMETVDAEEKVIMVMTRRTDY